MKDGSYCLTAAVAVTRPLLPIDFAMTEERTHDYMREHPSGSFMRAELADQAAQPVANAS